jgi:hypothetical protein
MIKLYQPQHEQFLNQMDGMNQLTSKTFITVVNLIARMINIGGLDDNRTTGDRPRLVVIC